MMEESAPKVEANSRLDESADSFLGRDFDQCFAQMRHYNDQIFDALKFSFTAYTALVGVASGLYQFSTKENVNLIPVAAAILGVGFLVGITMFALIVRNRVHFVFVARYINENRKLFLDRNPLGFQNVSGMHSNPNRPLFFHWRSTQTMLLFLLAFLNSALLAGFVFIVGSLWCLATIGFVVAAAVQLIWSILYLKSREGKVADIAAFGKNGTTNESVTDGSAATGA